MLRSFGYGIDVAYGALRRLRSRFATGAVAGYMGSGNTWVGAMLRLLIVEAYGLPKSAMRDVFLSDFPYHTKMPKIRKGIPRILHHHFLPFPEEPGLRGVAKLLSDLKDLPLVILIRDPKDALFSSYLHNVHRQFGYMQNGRYTAVKKFTGTPDQFMRESPIGFPKWIDYYNELAAARLASRSPTLVMPYQVLWSDTVGALKEIADALRILNANERMFESAVENCRIENMREVEARSSEHATPIPNLFSHDSSNPDARKARVGGTGSWKGQLADSTVQWIDDHTRKNLSQLYEVLWRRI